MPALAADNCHLFLGLSISLKGWPNMTQVMGTPDHHDTSIFNEWVSHHNNFRDWPSVCSRLDCLRCLCAAFKDTSLQVTSRKLLHSCCRWGSMQRTQYVWYLIRILRLAVKRLNIHDQHFETNYCNRYEICSIFFCFFLGICVSITFLHCQNVKQSWRVVQYFCDVVHLARYIAHECQWLCINITKQL